MKPAGGPPAGHERASARSAVKYEWPGLEMLSLDAGYSVCGPNSLASLQLTRC